MNTMSHFICINFKHIPNGTRWIFPYMAVRFTWECIVGNFDPKNSAVVSKRSRFYFGSDDKTSEHKIATVNIGKELTQRCKTSAFTCSRIYLFIPYKIYGAPTASTFSPVKRPFEKRKSNKKRRDHGEGTRALVRVEKPGNGQEKW